MNKKAIRKKIRDIQYIIESTELNNEQKISETISIINELLIRLDESIIKYRRGARKRRDGSLKRRLDKIEERHVENMRIIDKSFEGRV